MLPSCNLYLNLKTYNHHSPHPTGQNSTQQRSCDTTVYQERYLNQMYRIKIHTNLVAGIISRELSQHTSQTIQCMDIDHMTPTYTNCKNLQRSHLTSTYSTAQANKRSNLCEQIVKYPNKWIG